MFGPEKRTETGEVLPDIDKVRGCRFVTLTVEKRIVGKF